MNKILEVYLPKFLNKPLSYRQPATLSLTEGDIVEVPLRGGRSIGVVWQQDSRSDLDEGKIRDVISKHPDATINKQFKKFLEHAAQYNMAPLNSLLRMVIPVKDMMPTITPAYKLGAVSKATAKQQKVIELMRQETALAKKDIADKAGVTLAIVNNLIKNRVLIETAIEKDKPVLPKEAGLYLNDLQQDAFDKVKGSLSSYNTILLQGVTGSGKTELYFAMISEVLQQGQALIIVPEIVLTNQLVARIAEHFAIEPTVWHSSLSPGRRRKNWNDIVNGDAKLIVGARSALFLPFADLKIIVVDEEHDSSLKQEEGVVYHGRDMAVMRGYFADVPVILSSATPSLETIHNVNIGKYQHITLSSRYGGASLPEIQVVDMKEDKGKCISGQLYKALEENLQKQKQSLLFLNRRGYAPIILCHSCGHKIQCPNCSVSLVVHKKRGGLLCHYCNFRQNIPANCPECKKNEPWVNCGPGVEKVAEEVGKLFPGVNIDILTSDTTDIQNVMENIKDGHTDIIVGTQIIAKGHHFPNLTLVGIIDADLGLYGGDLRATERTHQLLYQVAGRAGREQDKGRVLIQSYLPDSNIMKSVISGNDQEFFTQELQNREIAGMPPFGKLAALVISGSNDNEVHNYAKNLVSRAPYNQEELDILGPAPAPLFFLRNQYRYRILLRADKGSAIRTWLNKALIYAPPNHMRVKVDIDPYSFL